MKDRRIGKFDMSLDHINNRPKVVLAVLSGSIVVRAESLWHKSAVEYVAINEAFDPVPDGVEPPRYDVLVQDLIGGKYSVRFVKSALAN